MTYAEYKYENRFKNGHRTVKVPRIVKSSPEIIFYLCKILEALCRFKVIFFKIFKALYTTMCISNHVNTGYTHKNS